MAPFAPRLVTPSLTTQLSMNVDDTASPTSGSPSTPLSAGAKRKRAAEPKFYAVRIGNRPGIYNSWSDCLEQVRGFKNATFKSFPTLTDAERFMAGEDPSKTGHGSSSSLSYKFYAVRSGRVPGIYMDWPSAQKQIIGWQKPKHKCFSTRAEAQRFMDGGEAKAPDRAGPSDDDPMLRAKFHITDSLEQSNKASGQKKVKKAVWPSNESPIATGSFFDQYDEDFFEPGTRPLPPGTEDGFDPNIFLDATTGNVIYKTDEQRKATKLQAVGPLPESMIRIHTDGSSLRNGMEGAFAGVGVWFGPGDDRNLSEPLPGPRQTNQRAELTAILRALDIVPRDRDVTIVTDSRYAIDCLTVWCDNWRKNGWKTSAGKPVENKDIIETVLAKIEDRSAYDAQTIFEWIKGHANHPGNVAADKLAVEGARGAAAA